MDCGRCKKAVTKGKEEWCWFCPEPLCYPCWEEVGHCGHPEADAINKASLTMTYEERRDTALALWPDAEALVKVPKKKEKN